MNKIRLDVTSFKELRKILKDVDVKKEASTTDSTYYRLEGASDILQDILCEAEIINVKEMLESLLKFNIELLRIEPSGANRNMLVGKIEAYEIAIKLLSGGNKND